METLSSGGREMFDGYKINLCIHFHDPEMARAMQWLFRSGTVTDGDTCFTAYFHSSNAANTAKYLGLKKAKTQHRWKVAADMETEVEDEDVDELMQKREARQTISYRYFLRFEVYYGTSLRHPPSKEPSGAVGAAVFSQRVR